MNDKINPHVEHHIVTIRTKPLFVYLFGFLLAGLVISQCANRIYYGQCRYRYVISGCDYVSYVLASEEILRGQSPYYEDTDYIYTPLLALLMTPFIWFSETVGYGIWTVLSVIAFGYGAFRSGWRSRRS